MTKAKILVVEDELILGKGIELLLKKSGYSVCGPAASGEEALALARREKPDLALMDISIEGTMDGVEAAKRIRNELETPVIFLTAFSDSETVGKATGAEPYSYILKPYDDTELLIAIEVVLFKARSQRAVREREGWLDAVLRNVGDAILTLDENGRVTFLNRAAESILGWSGAEAEGRPIREVLAIESADGRNSIQDLRSWASDQCGASKCVARTRDNRLVPVEGQSAPILDRKGRTVGTVCVFRDVSERRAAEENLASTLLDLRAVNARIESKKALLHAIFQSMPCGVITLDREMRVRAMNPFVERLFGVSAESSLGSPMGSVFLCPKIHDRPAGPCGMGKCASSCVFTRAAMEAFEHGTARRAEVDYETDAAGRRGTLRLSIGAAVGKLEEETLCFLLVEDRTELATLKKALHTEASFAGIVGRDRGMQDLFETIREVADSSVPVLIQGESGTGKELVAAAIHEQGPRTGQRFVAVNCGALPEGLLESELFGHTKGAFTGAHRDKKGRFELADGGTLFLDEVGELSQAMQVKLLRVLQSGTFERVGGEETVKVDVRLLSATNRDLKKDVAMGRFRSDLFYRLCVVPIHVPPLCERRGDIPLLVMHILSRIALVHGREVQQISPEALVCLLDHPWPGNVRELENVLQYASIKSHGDLIVPGHLPGAFSRDPGASALRLSRQNRLTAGAVANALNEAKGNRVQAAKDLGVSRATLYRFLSLQNGSGAGGVGSERSEE